MKTLTRRRFLKSAVAAAATPLVAGPWIHGRAADGIADVDVVVVGAGIAGLMAAETLLQQGRSVLLLEASGRVGGRAQTDTVRFGVPFDRGAHWLHHGKINPLLAYARAQDFSVYPAPDEEILYVGERPATAAEYRAYEAAYEAARRAIGKAGAAHKDVSPASVVADAGEWTDLVHLNVGPFDMAKDFTRFSCADWWSGEDGADWYCREGYGALVQHRGRNIPAQLNTPVTKINWGGAGVVVTTPRGDIKARKCIVTVSTGVLANQGIAFAPALSAFKQEAFHNISMGVYNHLALQFSENFFGIGDDGYLTYKINSRNAPSPRGMSMLVNISGTNLSTGDVGGEFARELEKEGVDGGVDFALGELRGIFGGEVDRHFIKGDATRWGGDPLFYGSYASAEPGAFQDRRRLRAAVAKRIYFAGEACSNAEWSTVNGAYKTGIAAAERVHRSLG